MKTHTKKGTFHAVEMRGPEDTEPTLANGNLGRGSPLLFSAKSRANSKTRMLKGALPTYKFRAVPVEVTFRWEAKP